MTENAAGTKLGSETGRAVVHGLSAAGWGVALAGRNAIELADTAAGDTEGMTLFRQMKR